MELVHLLCRVTYLPDEKVDSSVCIDAVMNLFVLFLLEFVCVFCVLVLYIKLIKMGNISSILKVL